MSNPRNTLECAETGSLIDLKNKNDELCRRLHEKSNIMAKKRKAKDKTNKPKKSPKVEKRGSRKSLRLSNKPRINYSELD